MSPKEPSKLLIVDDLPENLRALDALIRDEARQVFQAGSGEEALTLMLEHEFALAILDVQMPGMDGFELAELMRGTERTRNIPIVFVSAAGRELNYAFKGYEQGAVDFLHKPIDPDAVRSKVNVFVTLDQQRREMRRQMEALERSRREQDTLLRELNKTQEELQRSLRMRDDFMSLVAHELRTPLNTLFLETQMRSLQLKRGNLPASTPEQVANMIKRDERQIKAMIRLIDDMLDVSRMKSGTLSIRPGKVELMGLLERVVNDLSLQAAAANSTLQLASHAPVEGIWDEFRIEQVIVNLLTNALRYGGGGTVEVSVHQVGCNVRIDVRDHGKGIAPDYIDRIFEPYERGAKAGEPKGLGLGLYISRQLATSHGGALTVQSTPGEGATFSLLLPCSEAEVPAAAVSA
ncbi:ATP-binding protein [Massilia norwichensis]|uniref:histidine kinase n=1 Tax=Massilia norwichensis TaxID=1442366 RepID=A0ABT2A6W8_9BURK|nr:hybrid sensor histidine kinase/response regulator [Massilia norwichensis]MCS0589899.1 hybrid sensor histidine kinase/response regulator [Massilia norwichensis]